MPSNEENAHSIVLQILKDAFWGYELHIPIDALANKIVDSLAEVELITEEPCPRHPDYCNGVHP